jgi:membrane protease YdiL (CAAX protease family)
MNPITSFVKRHPQITFWGIVWSTNFFGWYMNSRNPSDLWLLFIYGSFFGGLLVTAIADGRSGLKTYFSRIVRWRVGVKWYLAAIFIPLALRFVAYGLNLLSGANLSANIQMPSWSDAIGEFLVIFLIIALGEEPGFRGFALPRFLVGRSALMASLILGVLHAIWHLPNFLTGDDHPIVILIIISGAVINTWLFNHTNGSVFIAMVLHASVNTWLLFFNPLFSGTDEQMQTIWLAVAYTAFAILLPVLNGAELGRKREVRIGKVTTDQPIELK